MVLYATTTTKQEQRWEQEQERKQKQFQEKGQEQDQQKQHQQKQKRQKEKKFAFLKRENFRGIRIFLRAFLGHPEIGPKWRPNLPWSAFLNGLLQRQ